MEFRDVDDLIGKRFGEDEYYTGSYILWKDYIEDKDLGIEFVKSEPNPDYDNLVYVYRIIDREKWFLNKIKYGI